MRLSLDSLPVLVGAHGMIYGGVLVATPGIAGADVIAASVVLASGLIAASVVDMRTFLIPDWSSLGLVLSGLGATAWFSPGDLGWHGLAALGWFLLFAAISAFYLRVRGIDGLGLGDAKLMAAGGAWLGPFASPSALLIASLGAAAVLGTLLLSGREPERVAFRTGIAFGPFLSLGIWITWLYGPMI